MAAVTQDHAAKAPQMGPQRRRGRRRNRESRLVRLGLPTLVVLVIFALWEALPRLGLVNEIILPPATETLQALFEVVQEPFFWEAVRTTATETFAGFVLGATFGWFVGTMIGMFRLAQIAFYPPAVALQVMPSVALVPVLLTWFGFGMTSKIVMAAIICFFPVLLNTVVGLQTVDNDSRTLMRSLGASRLETYRKLLLPASLPVMFAGLKYGLTLALVGAIVAEFVGGSEGLGVLIKTFNFQLEVRLGFAVVLVLLAFGLALWGMMSLLERKVVFWKGRR
jgi:NitT/TauT family transport system permease protein